jgi:hypothetical protein
MPEGPDLPAALMRAVSRGWTGVTLVHEPETVGEDLFTLLHVGDAPDLADAHLGVCGGRPGEPAGHVLRMWVCDGSTSACPSCACALDLAHSGGRRVVRRLLDDGAMVVCAALAGRPETLRRARLGLSPALAECLRDILALAEEWHTDDPPPFNIPAERWRGLAVAAPVLAAAEGDRADVVLVVPPAVLAAGDDPVGALSFALASGDDPSLVARLWRGGREVTVDVPLDDPAQRELALRIPHQRELYLVAADPLTGDVVQMLRAALSRGDARAA